MKSPRCFCLPMLLHVAAFLTCGAALSVPLTREQRSEALARIDSLCAANRADSALAAIAPLLPQARAAGDSSLVAALLVRRGGLYAALGQAQRSEPILREAISLATALGDSAVLCLAVRWLSVAVGSQGRLPEAVDLYNRLLVLSRARKDRANEGWALVGLAWQAECEGRSGESARMYRRASELFAEAKTGSGEAWALNGLGTALSRLGTYEGALNAYRRAAAIARRMGNVTVESFAVNNIGTRELSLGDPSAALEDFQRAYDLQSKIGNKREMVTPALNISICETELGRYRDAMMILEKALADCTDQNYMDLEGKVLNQMAAVKALQGFHHEAAAFYRRSLGLGEALPLQNRAAAMIGLSGALVQIDSISAAMAVLRQGSRIMKSSANVQIWLDLESNLGERLVELGRNREALEHLRRAAREAERLGLSGYQVPVLTLLARAQRALGRPDSALVLLEQASRAWESDRSLPLDPEWRERRGASSRMLSTDLAALLLDEPPEVAESERVRAAFDRLQRFKARTLLERMLGPGEGFERISKPAPPEPVTLETLQQKILRDGELLLDAFLGPRESFLFVVTREECRVIRLPSEEQLAPKLRLYYEILSDPAPEGASDDAETIRSIGQGIALLFLGPIADLLERSNRIILAPDGPLNLLPFGELSFSSQDPVARDAVMEEKEWVRVPSVTILAWQRTQSARSEIPRSARILALAGAGTDSGQALEGALHEIGALKRRYAHVDTVMPSSGGDSSAVLTLFNGYDVLHLAAHTRLDDQHPWRSAIYLVDPLEVAVVRAAQIAEVKLDARLAVLSSCESAGGGILSGEGVQGLSSAFLSAGVPAVVATLWPVDDRVTVAFMDRFYRGLADGRSVAASLRRAQMAVRRDPSTRHPFFWAGFVLVGDGDVRLTMQRRLNPAWPFGIAALVFFGLVLAAGCLRKGKTR